MDDSGGISNSNRFFYIASVMCSQLTLIPRYFLILFRKTTQSLPLCSVRHNPLTLSYNPHSGIIVLEALHNNFTVFCLN